MKKVIIILLMIFVSNSCIPYLLNEIRKEDWKEGWWWNQKYPPKNSKEPKKYIVCKKNICEEKYSRYPVFQ